ncbi:anthocyanin 3'-O-beta-glucosyltransferase-like [Dendrobium catenatum]|uniref:UDP-glycosyltransferase 90A1 n=1 Tax=Dendrobium catenatum TaxID=906689 RepID=A0A2I0VTL5_9ASPA|nr:anthocyanin 3'-O-beta-glucosyltransferase-like [Dendrobium catenatum]PKU66758.1 UDP-glycosyltransferase 90A1 [Dendrobium catenatum]
MTTSAMVAAEKEDHVLIFPFLSKGHTIPLLHLAAALSSRNILITLFTTPANVPFFRRYLSSSGANAAKIQLLILPFPNHPNLPAGVESSDSLPSFSLFPTFLGATTSLHDPFLRLVRSLLRSPSPPLCLISDFFLGWTLTICRRFGLPRLVFHGMSTFSMSLIKSLWNNIPKDEPFSVPGAPPEIQLTLADLPEAVINSVDPPETANQVLESTGPIDTESWGVIVNSFADIEPPAYVQLLESFYGPVAGGRVWLVGPLNLLTETEPVEKPSSESECIRWLDRQPDGSVIYVAFGTQVEISDEQLDEVAHGLVLAGIPFLWAVRSETWRPPKRSVDLGRIERGWVPQKQVLSHVAIGGFVSHCGWNSVLEAVSAGVALLTWPMIAEQWLNAKMVAEVIGVGIRLRIPAAGVVVGRKEVEEGVRELMEGEKGRRARERAAELAEKAKAAVVKGGSSYETLDKLLEELRKVPTTTAVMEVVEGEAHVEGEVKMVHSEWRDGLQIA